MALLDTTVFLDLGGRGGKKKKVEAQDILRKLISAGETLLTSRINVAEMYVGVELSDDPVKELAAIEDHLSWIGVLEMDDPSARSFARIRAHLQRRGKLVGDLDILIAGIALTNNESVVTRNLAHFQNVPGLKVIGYGY